MTIYESFSCSSCSDALSGSGQLPRVGLGPGRCMALAKGAWEPGIAGTAEDQKAAPLSLNEQLGDGCILEAVLTARSWQL